jgi:hypothetical protein
MNRLRPLGPLSAIVLASLFGCSHGTPEPKSPEERIAADEEKLEDMEKHGVNTGGTEQDTKALKEDIEDAKKEEAATSKTP